MAAISEQALFHDGLERRYLLYVPANYQPNGALLLVLHGGGGRADGMIKLTYGGFQQLADEQGFIVAYPDGIKRHWNDGREVRGRYSEADDVGFIHALIEQLGTQYKLNPKRIFVTGISNGGHMAYRLACDLSGQIAGIAAVAALMPQTPGQVCAPNHPLGVLIIAGTDDPLVPYLGGNVGGRLLRRGTVASALETVRFWAAVNGCKGDPITSTFADTDPNDGVLVRQTRYEGCAAPVLLFTVEGGGHTWSGGSQYLGERLIGKTSRDIDATRLIWAFFQSLG